MKKYFSACLLLMICVILKSQPLVLRNLGMESGLSNLLVTDIEKDGNFIYHIEGTAPLLKFYVRDGQEREVFRVEKEILHVLPAYRFYLKGELYGKLEKKLEFIRDHFTMDVAEGKLELREYAGSIGRNFSVTLNGRMLGAIMEDMQFTLHNIVFDNSVLMVYDRDYLPLMTAMAIMVAREIARDEEDE